LTNIDWPLPSEDLDTVSLPIELLSQGSGLYRIAKTEYSSPVFFGPPFPNRFDVAVGVMYTALDHFAAFRESVLHGEIDLQQIDLTRLSGMLAKNSISYILFNRELRLVKAYDDGLQVIGANHNLSRASRDRRSYTQIWSKSLWKHPDQVDGIIYRSHYDKNRFCVALYADRMRETLRVESTEPLSGQVFQPMLKMIMKNYNLKLKER
jgi:hypothetical protein